MYTRVESRFWQDEKMRNVSDDARYLMLYLLTSPHRNILGLYFLPFPYACFDLGWDEKRFKKALEELLKTGGIAYDALSHVVLVKNYLKHNPLENPNQVKHAVEKLNELPETHLFRSFLTVIEQFDKPFIQPLIERLQERLGQPVTVTVTELITVTEEEAEIIHGAETAPWYKALDKRTKEAERKMSVGQSAGQDYGQSIGQDNGTSDPNRNLNLNINRDLVEESDVADPSLQEKRFNEFWTAYPKKVGKKAAWAAWNKIKPDADLYNRIMTAIGKAKRTEQWRRENGRFIPNPTTWLNQGRWDDEYEEGPINGVNSKYSDGYHQQPAASPPGSEGKRDALAGFKRAEDYDFYRGK